MSLFTEIEYKISRMVASDSISLNSHLMKTASTFAKHCFTMLNSKNEKIDKSSEAILKDIDTLDYSCIVRLNREKILDIYVMLRSIYSR